MVSRDRAEDTGSSAGAPGHGEAASPARDGAPVGHTAVRGRARLLLPRLAGGALAALLLCAAAPYALMPVYTFARPKAFSGPDFFNPYADAHGRWWKANFHAHSRAWHGLTSGRQRAARLLRYYHDHGYDIAGLSNYERIDGGVPADSDFIPIYEHGYSIRKIHQLVIGATRVTWLDFPLWQTLSEKQYILDRLDAAGGVVAIAHPWLRHGYSPADIRRLTHYRLMEVIRQTRVGEPWWDAALSAGHPAWIIGDDDVHNLNVANTAGVSWTMVRAPSTRRDDVLAALRAGHTYGVNGHDGHNDILVRAVELHDDTLTVTTEPGALSFSFIGQDGALREVVHDPQQASYALRRQDTYVRTVIRTPHTVMYLNPVVRYDGEKLVQPAATLSLWRTGLARALFLLVVLAVLVGYRIFRGRRAAGGAGQRGASPGRRRYSDRNATTGSTAAARRAGM
jgi:hypothetical protein